MNPDDFEQRLQRQPLREVPDEWRAEILGTASATAATESSRFAHPATSWLSTLNSQLATFLWPHPKAWAGLAAVWMVIFGLKVAPGDEMPLAGKQSTVSPEIMAELQRQKVLFAELVGGDEVRDAKPPKRLPPRPRSERYGETRAV